MSKELVSRIRAARQSSVDLGNGKSLICRRPTNLEMLEMSGKATQGQILTKFIDGWSGFTELDLVPGGTGAEAKFDAELFAEWVADNPFSWPLISDAIVTAYQAHEKSLADAVKK